MAFGRRSTISDKLEDYSLMIMGSSGVGKTTVMAEMCEKEFGVDGYMILDTGKEAGMDALDGYTYEPTLDYKKWDEVTKDIIKNKKTEYPNLKVIVNDTLDQLICMAEKFATDAWNVENRNVKNFVKAKSVNGIYGGFGAYFDIVTNMILDRTWELKKVGVQSYFVCHSKTKDIVDPLTSQSYTVLTSDMAQKYFNAFKTKMHVVAVAAFDRAIEEESTGRKNVVTKKDVTIKKVVDEKRKLIFRSDDYVIDSKSRLSGIVDEIPLDSDELIKALKDAIKNSKRSNSENAQTSKPIAKKSKKEEVKSDPIPEEFEEDLDENILDEDVAGDTTDEVVSDVENVAYPEDLVESVRNSFKELDAKDPLKKEIRSIVKEYGKFDDVDEEILRQLYDKLN